MLLSLNALLLAKRMFISRWGEGKGVRKKTEEGKKVKKERGRREKKKSTFLYINRRMLEKKKLGTSRKEKNIRRCQYCCFRDAF